ncbi:hypothetical protein QNI19_21775 [Cytophagaceae bacterium DM2B3-1]|uniref:DUF4251 domain-containing protein n=1 Tax=Xanthocytophaga flava TaxID=3048013 RepID=A0ABT7CPC0_9BACT|nr:hypothetical protein [Xanthocytophaga flavus]MDJ1468723.1 hypothetical protein [Xanthocytophaga flavus]MDJ1495583.1 hypothetical protein [Xanthocytophaga flavus]
MKRILCVVLLSGALIVVFFAFNKENATASATKVAGSLNPPVWEQSISKERAARVKRGDTMALPGKELLRLLPNCIASYQPSGTSGSSLISLMGSKYRVAEQTYKKDKKTLKVSITDYNGAYTLYNVATATFASGVAIDNNEQIVRPIALPSKEAKGWETFDKQSNKATVFVGIGERFLITIEATDQPNPQDLEKIVEGLDLGVFSGK